MNRIEGGVTAPKGFISSGIACGIKKNGERDLALIVSEKHAVGACVFTTNKVKGHSLKLSIEHAKDGFVKAIIINSGNANACNGEKGGKDAHVVCDRVAKLLSCKKDEVIFNSTGVIGALLPMDKLENGIDIAFRELKLNGGGESAEAIMTTDTVKKEIAVAFELHGKKVTIGAMAKGSGMIHPNMATMIGVITTDANISKSLLQSSLKKVTDRTFNRTSVDGDTSVCDMVAMMANGDDPDLEINAQSQSYIKFMSALDYVCTFLAKQIAKDGEGATKLLDIKCVGAKSKQDAYEVVLAVAKSPLVKTAFFGMDANWGRIITAVGYSKAEVDPDRISIKIGDMEFCKKGQALSFSEKKALEMLQADEIEVLIDLGLGEYSDRIFTCDFSYDYVKINASYRS